MYIFIYIYIYTCKCIYIYIQPLILKPQLLASYYPTGPAKFTHSGS